MVSIRTFGQLKVTLDGEDLALPTSRKTRALLAFLLLSPGKHSRQSLCDLLWDTTDDPRAALRWSLTKLRVILKQDGVERLCSDRLYVWLDHDQLEDDFTLLTMAQGGDSPEEPLAEELWQASAATLLGDCELPNQHNYSAWLEKRRSAVRRARARLARDAAEGAASPMERELWAQRWLSVEPFAPDAAQLAVSTLHIATGLEAAQDLARDLAERFREAELPVPEFFSAHDSAPPTDNAPIPHQSIRFVETEDSVCIAWASVGADTNPPLVKAANWLNHLELDWGAPIWSPLFREFANTHRLIRYDERGCGLSDWDAQDISFESFVTDLEQVVDAAGLEAFPLLGISQGAAVSIEYAARYPDRVSHLVLFGAYDCGWRHIAGPEEVRQREAVMVLTETGWGSDNPAYRHMFSQTFMPDATAQELKWFDEFQRQTTSPENAVRFLEAFSTIDVRKRLSDVQCPTLVIHSRGDERIPMASARSLAARIPNATFASVESRNHLLLGREEASGEFLRLVRDFLAS
ncbi:MAG: alpha/beta fold hydrolase [Pseudomonadota bacterium]